jgi:orotate phosphoribosyltransferase
MLVNESLYQSSRDYCRHYIDSYCVWRSKNGETLPGKNPKKRYLYQFYMSRALHNVDFLDNMSNLFVYHVEREVGHFDFQITGLQTGATPMVIGLSIMCKHKFGLNINSFSVRKTQKEYGLMNWIEGLPIKDKPIMIVDDLINSANTLVTCHNILTQFNATVLPYAFACAIRDENKDVTDSYLRERGIDDMTFLSPFTINELR